MRIIAIMAVLAGLSIGAKSQSAQDAPEASSESPIAKFDPASALAWLERAETAAARLPEQPPERKPPPGRGQIQFVGGNAALDRTRAYFEIIQQLARTGETERALKLVEAIRDDPRHASALRFIAGALAEKGDIAGAEKLFASITLSPSTRTRRVDSPYWTTAYQIAYNQARGGDTAGALRTASAIEDPFDRFSTFVSIAQQQLHRSDRDGARQTLALARPLAQTYDGDRTDTSVIVSLGIIHEWERPLSVAHVRAKMALDLAELFIDAGDSTSADEMLTIAVEFSKKVPALGSDEQEIARETLKALGLAQVKAGKLDAAAQSAAAMADQIARAEVEAEITTARAAAGDFATAYESAKKIVAVPQRVQAYVKLAQADSKRSAEILKYAAWLAGTIREEYARNWAFIEIAAGQAKAGDQPAAQRAISAIHVPDEKIDACLAISKANAKFAGTSLQMAAKIAAAINDPVLRNRKYAEIAAEHARQGDAAAALQSISRITGNWQQAGAYRVAAYALAHRGQPQEVANWADSLTDPALNFVVSLGAAKGITTRSLTPGSTN